MKNKQKEIGNHEKNKKNIQKAKKLSLENKHQADTIKTRRKPGTKQRWKGKRSMKELLIFDDYKREGQEEGIEQGMQKDREDGIRIFIQDKLDDGIDRETILAKLRKLYALSTEEAEKYLLLFTPHSS